MIIERRSSWNASINTFEIILNIYIVIHYIGITIKENIGIVCWYYRLVLYDIFVVNDSIPFEVMIYHFLINNKNA